MALELLVQKIRNDAATEVESILAEAETKAQALEARTRARAEAVRRRELDALRLSLEYAASQQRSQKEIEVRAALLQERENLLNETRQRWVEWLRGLPPQEEASLLRGLMEKGRACVPEGVIVCQPRARDMLGPQPGFRFDAREDAPPGLRLVSGDGAFTADLSCPALVDEFWSRRRPEIAAVLFGEALAIRGPEEAR